MNTTMTKAEIKEETLFLLSFGLCQMIFSHAQKKRTQSAPVHLRDACGVRPVLSRMKLSTFDQPWRLTKQTHCPKRQRLLTISAKGRREFTRSLGDERGGEAAYWSCETFNYQCLRSLHLSLFFPLLRRSYRPSGSNFSGINKMKVSI